VRISRLLPMAALALTACFEARLSADAQPNLGDAAPFPNQPDAGMSQDDAADVGSTRHVSCASGPETAAAPPVGASALTVDAKIQNGFRAVDCESAPVLERCDRGSLTCSDVAICIFPIPDEQGFCVDYSPGLRSSIEEGDVPFAPTSYRDGACVTHLSNEQRAALCCAEIPGLDCERWPRATASRPGELCVRDDQCETGLVCVTTDETCLASACAYRNTHYGRCACPDAAKGSIGNAVDCERAAHPPEAWGLPAQALAPGACIEAAEGFAIEVVATAPEGALVPTVSRADDGEVYATYVAAGSLHIFTSRELDWPLLEEVTGAAELRHFELSLSALYAEPVGSYEALPLSIAFGLDGDVALAFATETTLVWASPSAGTWDVNSKPVNGILRVVLTLIDGERWLAYSGTDFGNIEHESAEGPMTWPTPCLLGLSTFLKWPSDSVRLHCNTDKGAILYDPVAEGSLALTSGSERVALADGELLFAEPGATSLRLARLTDTLMKRTEPVWSIKGPNRGNVVSPSLALAPDGTPAIAHRTPDGTAISRTSGDGKWATTLVTTERGTPQLVFDNEGHVQIFYAADANWNGLPEQLRRVREGTCP